MLRSDCCGRRRAGLLPRTRHRTVFNRCWSLADGGRVRDLAVVAGLLRAWRSRCVQGLVLTATALASKALLVAIGASERLARLQGPSAPTIRSAGHLLLLRDISCFDGASRYGLPRRCRCCTGWKPSFRAVRRWRCVRDLRRRRPTSFDDLAERAEARGYRVLGDSLRITFSKRQPVWRFCVVALDRARAASPALLAHEMAMSDDVASFSIVPVRN